MATQSRPKPALGELFQDGDPMLLELLDYRGLLGPVLGELQPFRVSREQYERLEDFYSRDEAGNVIERFHKRQPSSDYKDGRFANASAFTRWIDMVVDSFEASCKLGKPLDRWLTRIEFEIIGTWSSPLAPWGEYMTSRLAVLRDPSAKLEAHLSAWEDAIRIQLANFSPAYEDQRAWVDAIREANDWAESLDGVEVSLGSKEEPFALTVAQLLDLVPKHSPESPLAQIDPVVRLGMFLQVQSVIARQPLVFTRGAERLIHLSQTLL